MARWASISVAKISVVLIFVAELLSIVDKVQLSVVLISAV